jgi:prepilin-type N-terminal cleavage/methylation domain-containing protein
MIEHSQFSHKEHLRRHYRGFTLVEIAVVLVIIAILTTAIAVPLAAQIEQTRTSETTRQLEAIKEAIYGFAIANGRLPCPANGATGVESFNAGGDATNGNCTSTSGFLPGSTLGLSGLDASGFATDAWGTTQNRIRYAVTDVKVNTVTSNCTIADGDRVLTKRDGIRGVSMNCVTSKTPMLTIRSTSVNNAAAGCTPNDLAVQAPFVVFSLGKNAPTGGTGADEAINVAANATIFVSHTPSAAGSCSGEFDDIVTWGNLNTLFSRMVQAGKLP